MSNIYTHTLDVTTDSARLPLPSFQYVRLNVEVVGCKGPRNTDKIYSSSSSSSSSCTKEMMKANNKVSSSKMDELRFRFR